jgi:hypothetical protein
MPNDTNLPDPVIDEVRDVRRKISARFGHDPRRLVEHYIELQKQHADRLEGRPESIEAGGAKVSSRRP